MQSSAVKPILGAVCALTYSSEPVINLIIQCTHKNDCLLLQLQGTVIKQYDD